MSNLPKKSEDPLAKSTASQLPTTPLERLASSGSMVSFSYSYREISSSNGQTHIKAKQTTFENGTMRSEEMEGTLSQDSAGRMQQAMQQQFRQQMNALLHFSPFSAFLPPSDKTSSRD